jgi:hypothetical protein
MAWYIVKHTDSSFTFVCFRSRPSEFHTVISQFVDRCEHLHTKPVLHPVDKMQRLPSVWDEVRNVVNVNGLLPLLCELLAKKCVTCPFLHLQGYYWLVGLERR